MTTSAATFTRRFDPSLIASLKAERLFTQRLLPDIKKGEVFAAIRKDLIDFYHKGGRLFQFDKDGFHTHVKYAAVISSPLTPYLTERQLASHTLAGNFYDNYDRIKENCSKYSGVEANGVSDLYKNYSYIFAEEPYVVLDIEISLRALNGADMVDQEESITNDRIDDETVGRTRDRIDILLYSIKSQELRFVEAKHYSNGEIWSKRAPKVIHQINRYEKQIKSKNKEILTAYAEYIKAINDLFGLNLQPPISINPKVILFILGFDTDQKKGRLNRLIMKNPQYNGILNYPKGDTNKVKILPLWNAKPI